MALYPCTDPSICGVQTHHDPSHCRAANLKKDSQYTNTRPEKEYGGTPRPTLSAARSYDDDSKANARVLDKRQWDDAFFDAKDRFEQTELSDEFDMSTFKLSDDGRYASVRATNSMGLNGMYIKAGEDVYLDSYDWEPVTTPKNISTSGWPKDWGWEHINNAARTAFDNPNAHTVSEYVDAIRESIDAQRIERPYPPGREVKEFQDSLERLDNDLAHVSRELWERDGRPDWEQLIKFSKDALWYSSAGTKWQKACSNLEKILKKGYKQNKKEDQRNPFRTSDSYGYDPNSYL